VLIIACREKVQHGRAERVRGPDLGGEARQLVLSWRSGYLVSAVDGRQIFVHGLSCMSVDKDTGPKLDDGFEARGAYARIGANVEGEGWVRCRLCRRG
jgi:hypothetical protein